MVDLSLINSSYMETECVSSLCMDLGTQYS